MGLRHVLAAALAALGAASVALPGPAAAEEPLLCLVMSSREVLHVTTRPFEACFLAP